MNNRSVPADVLLPHIAYRNVEQAIAWLTEAFGFTEHYRYGAGGQMGAQMHLGDAWFMLRGLRDGEAVPAVLGYGTQSLTVFLDDVEAHSRRAVMAGATIIEELHETEYGELQYAAVDLDGHHWLFSRHVKDVAPEAWGASTAPR